MHGTSNSLPLQLIINSFPLQMYDAAGFFSIQYSVVATLHSYKSGSLKCM